MLTRYNKYLALLKVTTGIVTTFLVLFSCSERIWDNPNDPGSDNYNGGEQIGSVITAEASRITTSSAVLGGNVTSDGNASITERGIVYSTSQNPTMENNKVVIGSGKGIFSTTVSGLTANTTYYVRAYSTNKIGTSFGFEVSFKTYFAEVTDIEGNSYPTIKIGEQIWMAENLKTTKYIDGTTIPNVTDNTIWSELTTGAYCWYDNGLHLKDVYGALYNWYAVTTGRLCPTGWHVPTDAEWANLANFLGGESVAGGKMKSVTGWNSPNTDATNSSAFTALPGGGRVGGDSKFSNIGYTGLWWSSTEYGSSSTWYRYLLTNYAHLGRGYFPNFYGFSVRCVRDN